MIAVKTHISIDLPKSISISGVVINLSLQARTTDDQCCNFTPSISPENMCIFSSLSCINEERSRLTHLSSLIKYNYRSLAGITKILPIIKVVQPRPNIRSDSVLLCLGFSSLYLWFCYVIYAQHFEYSRARCFVICSTKNNLLSD